MPSVNAQILDNPAWFALNNEQAHLDHSGRLAALYHSDVAPFAGLKNCTSDAIEELGSLIFKDGSVLLQALNSLPPTSGIKVNYLFDV